MIMVILNGRLSSRERCRSWAPRKAASPNSNSRNALQRRYGRGVIGDVALPDHLYMPTQSPQFSTVLLISSDVFRQLLLPEFDVGGWKFGPAAPFMAMPKATVHEQNRAPLRKNQIWFSRQILTV